MLDNCNKLEENSVRQLTMDNNQHKSIEELRLDMLFISFILLILTPVVCLLGIVSNVLVIIVVSHKKVLKKIYLNLF